MSDWPVVSLGEVTTKIGSGSTPRGGKSVYRDSGVSFIRSQNVYDNHFESEGIARIGDAAAEQLNNVEVLKRDVLVCITGESVTRTSMVDPSVLPARVSQHVAIIRADPAKLDPLFLQATLLSPLIKNRMNTLSQAGATRRALTKEHLRGLQIELPPLEEQRRIAGVLGAFDDLAETGAQLALGMERLLASLFAYERFDTDGDSTLAEFVDVNPTYPKARGPVSFIEMSALPTSGYYVDRVGERERSSGPRFRNGDALLARITPCLENGKAAFLTSLSTETAASGSTEFIVLRSREGVPAIWPYLLIRSERFRTYAIQHMSGTTGRQRLDASVVASYPINRPSAVALTRLGRAAQVLVPAMDSLHEESKDLGRTRDELLPLLMSGAIRVRDVEDSVP